VTGETDLDKMLASIEVDQRPGYYCFAGGIDPTGEYLTADGKAERTSDEAAALRGLASQAVAMVTEPEGTSLVLPLDVARAHGLEPDYIAAWLTLAVHSSLEAVGLTAAISAALAGEGISCNILAGFHHDHLLVPVNRAEDAIAAIHALAGPPET